MTGAGSVVVMESVAVFDDRPEVWVPAESWTRLPSGLTAGARVKAVLGLTRQHNMLAVDLRFATEGEILTAVVTLGLTRRQLADLLSPDVAQPTDYDQNVDRLPATWQEDMPAFGLRAGVRVCDVLGLTAGHKVKDVRLNLDCPSFASDNPAITATVVMMVSQAQIRELLAPAGKAG